MTTYQGSCHCGQTRFEVEGELKGVMACNCSMCQRKGTLMWFVGRDQLRIHTPDDALATYLFNRHVIRHRFCPVCGIHPFGEGTDPAGHAMAAINIRCLDGVALDTVPVQHYDGRSA